MSKPKIIAIVNTKGGVGKSNITRTLAKGLCLADSNTTIIETDPQNSLREWSQQEFASTTPKVVNMNVNSEKSLRQNIENFNEKNPGCDYLVIDGCAFNIRFLNTILNISDFVIIPTQASPDDICQLGEIIELVYSIQLKRIPNNPLIARTLINKARLGTILMKQTQKLLKNPNNTGILCLKTLVRDYEAIRQAADVGKTAFECGNKNAKIDAQDLTNEVLELLH